MILKMIKVSAIFTLILYRSDTINSYVEFASEDIEDIRAVLSILGKHVYNVDEGDYIDIKIEPV